MVSRNAEMLAAEPAPAGAPAPLQDPVGFETPALRFQVSPEDGRYEISDLAGGVKWCSNAYRPRFGAVLLDLGGKKQARDLSRCKIKQADKALELAFDVGQAFSLPADGDAGAPRAGGDAGGTLRVKISARPDGKALDFSYEAEPQLHVENVRLLDEAFAVRGAEKGCLVMPTREGLLIPADSGLAFTHTFDTYTYEGCHMAMCGAVKAGAAVLFSWEDPYTAAEVRSALPARDAGGDARTTTPAGGDAGAPSGQMLSLSLVLRKTAKSFTVSFLGKGDYVTIAQAYRPLAKERGWLVTWDEKLKGHPSREKLFGAANVKLWSTLSRQMSEDSTKELSHSVNWTFDEAAQVAEHLKNDLRLDRVHFIIGGWIKRGYDNQHPDILPAAPECGGDEALAACAKRVRALGYLFDLHDNYQDIYRDSPSWNEDFIMKTPDGKLVKGGKWAGGRAYLTCSQQALELARRPQNLAAVQKLTDADAYFIDTTYAAGLCECFDPKHPLTRRDDMHWKQALSDYAREVFGIFGSECGREWAIPHADYFEGLTGVSGTYYHDAGLLKKLGGVSVPLFEIVYRDCIAMYGKYGYDINSAAEYVLHHVNIGRTLNYHSVPGHLYWKQPEPEVLALQPAVSEVQAAGPRQFSISYRWAVEKAPTGDWHVFVHFTDAAGQIKFQNDHQPEPPMSHWQAGEVREGPFTVSVPGGLSGDFDIRIGLFKELAERAYIRGCDKERRILAGKLKVAGDKIEFLPPGSAGVPPASGGDPGLFVRADGGWAEGLHPVDRFLKNTQEVLGPLNELTSQMQMTAHQLLGTNQAVRRSVFGSGPDAVETIVNLGASNYQYRSKDWGEITLPPYGFAVAGPSFVAFCALNFNGINYGAPAFFTLRSLDGKPIKQSAKVRVFHGFGDARIKVGAVELKVAKEAVVPAKAGE
ncbi:MAG: DUF5696 domain-containing protein [Planctomycetota bacterium]